MSDVFYQAIIAGIVAIVIAWIGMRTQAIIRQSAQDAMDAADRRAERQLLARLEAAHLVADKVEEVKEATADVAVKVEEVKQALVDNKNDGTHESKR